MLLLIDNFDSFTYNLFDYISQLGVACVVKRNDVSIDELSQLKISGIIISPGTGIPDQSGNLMAILDYFHLTTPILGICLGHQAIGQYFGASLTKAPKPMHGKISKLDLKEDCIFKNIPAQIDVVRYNSLILDLGENSQIKALAFSQKGELMALKHTLLPIWGLQYHPEAALSEYGIDTLRNWLFCNNIER